MANIAKNKESLERDTAKDPSKATSAAAAAAAAKAAIKKPSPLLMTRACSLARAAMHA